MMKLFSGSSVNGHIRGIFVQKRQTNGWLWSKIIISLMDGVSVGDVSSSKKKKEKHDKV
jgi:hypothetical protein